MLQDVLDTAKEKMKKTCNVYEKEMQGIRAGRANPQLLDRIMVDYYGTPTPINQVGNISSPEPRLLVIAPWEAKMITPIEKAIQKSDLGLNPSNDGKIIRLVFPELNEERRRELTKLASRSAEEAKVAVRSIRRDAIEQIKKMKKNSEITEDDQHEAEDPDAGPLRLFPLRTPLEKGDDAGFAVEVVSHHGREDEEHQRDADKGPSEARQDRVHGGLGEADIILSQRRGAGIDHFAGGGVEDVVTP